MASLSKKPKFAVDSKLTPFIYWCARYGFNLNCKVEVTTVGSVAQYGMIAIENIDQGEELFRIPRSMLLHPSTSAITKLLEENTDHLKSDSGWVPLLITLMYEYTYPESKWRPYLDLCLDCHNIDLPMFWLEDELNEVQGTGIPEAVTCDLTNIEKEYFTIVLPFIKKHPHIFNETQYTLDFYKKIVAFVMSYSFTEPSANDDDSSPPMMVPMADILNHVSKNNACLQFSKENLLMVTTKDIKQGEEVYNTYGELANWQLLHMYGFSELPSENIFDAVEFNATDLYEQARLMMTDTELFDKKITFLGTPDIFVVGVDGGVLTEDELHSTLKILLMTAGEFGIFKENDGWSSDDDNEINLDIDHLRNLPENWKQLLSSAIHVCLKRYMPKNDATERPADTTCSVRLKYSKFVRNDQKVLLRKMLHYLSL